MSDQIKTADPKNKDIAIVQTKLMICLAKT